MPQNLFEEIIQAGGRASKRRLFGKKLRKPYLLDVMNFEAFPAASLKENYGPKIWEFRCCLLIVLLVSLVFLARSFELQVLKSKEFSTLADKNKMRTYAVPAPRGVIYDRNGEVLAQNRPTFNLVLNVQACRMGKDLSLCKKLVTEIAREIYVDEEAVVELLGTVSPESVVLAKDLDKDVALSVEARRYPALDILAYPSREYLYPEDFAHLIGYTGLSNISLAPKIEGKTGLEVFYDVDLAGFPGERIIQVNSQNERVQEFDTKDPVAGKSLFLYVDLGLQRLAYELLRDEVEDPQKKAYAGVVVAQDPRNGGVLALVSYPSFDAQKMVSNITAKDLVDMGSIGMFPFFNRAIGASYAPGSIFKMVMASAILEEGIATPYKTIFDTGQISVAGYTFRNWKLEGHGEVDLMRAIQVSNDPYFYTMGGGYGGIKGLGIEKINKWATIFGYGTKTGIDLPGEVSGFVPNADYKDWYLGDTYITSIGQGDFLATPLQVNMVTSYFANGRELLKPRIAKSVGDEAEGQKAIISRDLVSQDNLEYIREGLKKAVEPGGTGYPFFDFPEKHGVMVAGKTGTSEYTDPEGNPGTHAMFTVWGPYDNAEIVLTVFLEGGGSGADDAAPIARKLFDYWFGDKGSNESGKQ